MEHTQHPRPRRRRRARPGLLPALGVVTAAGVVAFGVATPAASLGTAAPALVAAAPASGCAEVETIAVRGTGERQGGGIVAGPLATELQDQLPQTVETHDLVYPASFNYTASVRQGVEAMEARLTETSTECPDTQFVLIGYSQGADVIGDTLETGSVPAADQIGSVMLFGDPEFNSAEDFAVGDFAPGTDGIFPRETGALDEFADVMTSFCNGDDSICQRGARGAGHFRYDEDQQDAVDAVEADLAGADTGADATGAEADADDTGADDTGADATGGDETGADTGGDATGADDTGADSGADDTGAGAADADADPDADAGDGPRAGSRFAERLGSRFPGLTAGREG